MVKVRLLDITDHNYQQACNTFLTIAKMNNVNRIGENNFNFPASFSCFWRFEKKETEGSRAYKKPFRPCNIFKETSHNMNSRRENAEADILLTILCGVCG